jgi:6-pyruvoyltetrahydropterin/6-carboxytetrahydropterin synthase
MKDLQYRAWCSQHQMPPGNCFEFHQQRQTSTIPLQVERIDTLPTHRQCLRVRHNIEVAHRLSLLPGKCENIHGHSMWVEAELEGEVNELGVLLGMDFGSVKADFRHYLDTAYDHHLLLNKADSIATQILPGLALCDGDPTTENIARWIGEWCCSTYDHPGLIRVKIEVWETSVNCATWETL